MIKFAHSFTLLLGLLVLFQSCNKKEDSLILEECNNEKALNYGENNTCEFSSTIKIKKAIITNWDLENFEGYYNQEFDSIYVEITTDYPSKNYQSVYYESEKIFYYTFSGSQYNYDSLVYDFGSELIFNPIERGYMLNLRLKGYYNGYEYTNNLSHQVIIDLSELLYITYNKELSYPKTLQVNDSNEFEATLFFEWM